MLRVWRRVTAAHTALRGTATAAVSAAMHRRALRSGTGVAASSSAGAPASSASGTRLSTAAVAAMAHALLTRSITTRTAAAAPAASSSSSDAAAAAAAAASTTSTGGVNTVSVQFGRQSHRFPVSEASNERHGGWTMHQLTLACAKHWNLPAEQVLLHDGAGNIWPSAMRAADVVATRDAVHVKLAKPRAAILAAAASVGPSSSSSSSSAASSADPNAAAEPPHFLMPNFVQHTAGKKSVVTDRAATSPAAAASAASAAAAARLAQATTTTGAVDTTPVAAAKSTVAATTAAVPDADADPYAEADAEDVDAAVLSGAAAKAAAATSEAVVRATVTRNRLQLRVKYLLRTQTARNELTNAHGVSRKTQGAFVTDFAASLLPPGVEGRSAVPVAAAAIAAANGSDGGAQPLVLTPLTTEQMSAIVHGSDAEGMETLIPLFLKYVSRASPTKLADGSLDESMAWAANLTLPHEWYPLARQLKRKIVVHVGPTNSGKTYHALKRLREVESGVYCGPLRLLAWEVHEKLLKQGLACNLVTGQESVTVDGSRHWSSTIEMLDLQTIVDVGVIDEMQMIGNPQRGDVWTRAFLGMAAREVHVCGDPSMVPLVEELCSITGEPYEIRTYQRLTPLKVGKPVRSFNNIQRGDAIIAFSRLDLYSIKKQIEQSTNHKCCLIYGSLPPETRRQQAELFNDPQSGYDVLIATDAVGMGLNLNIRRVVFSTLWKFDGEQRRRLYVPEALQIGGRAGRFGTEHSGIGYVCTLNAGDDTELRELFRTPLEPLTRAGLSPSAEQLQQLHYHRPSAPLHALLGYMHAYATIDPVYFMVEKKEQSALLQAIERLPLSLHDRFVFSMAPVRTDNSALMRAFVHYADAFATTQTVELNTLTSPPRDRDVPKTAHRIEALENAYLHFDLYVWLARRYGDTVFVHRREAEQYRAKVAALIDRGLEAISPYYNEPNLRAKARRHALRREDKAKAARHAQRRALTLDDAAFDDANARANAAPAPDTDVR